ncbi:MAG: hypothetical protein HYR62_05600 [Actinobacteria bacterium]|nr:hypothetical protein [Actinomycetota bacterium]MBI3688514.1 hypothetical protein [Actinomycetota bacterium]
MSETTGTERATTDGRADDAGLFGDLPASVRFEFDAASRFARDAARQYQMCLDSRDSDGLPAHRPNAWALLFGQPGHTELTISGIEFVPNVRGSDKTVIAEFEAAIVPRFGEAYRNPERGFWCDERAVLAAIMRQAENGLELLGSVHSHPDWHEVGPPHERHLRLSEHPTRMDEYLFQQSRWPVNVIWYVSGGDAGAIHRVAAWRAGPRQCERLDLAMPAALHDEFDMASARS